MNMPLRERFFTEYRHLPDASLPAGTTCFTQDSTHDLRNLCA